MFKHLSNTIQETHRSDSPQIHYAVVTRLRYIVEPKFPDSMPTLTDVINRISAEIFIVYFSLRSPASKSQ